jgi:tetratricopeptide (TPR) repeat protein
MDIGNTALNNPLELRTYSHSRCGRAIIGLRKPEEMNDMAKRLRCPQGHEWQLAESSSEARECPTCGKQAETWLSLDGETAEHGSPSAFGVKSPIRGEITTIVGQQHQPSFGRYRLVQQIGAGGFGLVFRGWDPELQREVAIKVPRADRTDEANFLTEGRAVARLRHPGIVQVFDVGTTESGDCYLVSEFIEGESLESRLRNWRPSPREAVSVVAAVAEALHYAHQHGNLVHRDIKPANILIDREGVPKVVDFGLALWGTGFGEIPAVMGTPAYMSPEQARGEGQLVDARSDVFSLGAVFFELLTGQRPFQADNLVHLLHRIATTEARPPRQLNHAVPRELDRICLKALARERSRRYSTAGDFLEDLRNWEGSERDDADRAGATAAAKKPWNVPYRRNPHFTGRDAALARLHCELTGSADAGLLPKAVVSGLGGIGKTQIAVEYAYRFRDDYAAVFWVRSDNRLEATTSFCEIAALLALPESRLNNQQEVETAVKRWLEANPGWLLIFDNADRPADIAPLMPKEGGYVLVTSRAQVFDAIKVSTPLPLEVLRVEEAQRFLMERTGRSAASEDEQKAAQQIATELGCLPLALEQAAAYMATKLVRFQDYLISYQKRRLQLVETAAPQAGNYPHSVATTWALNIQHVESESPAAGELLRASAFLHPDQIPLELVSGGAAHLGPPIATVLAEVADDPVVLNDMIQPLTTYSLIERDIDLHTYSVHRLVQAVVRDAMGDETRRRWAERVVRAVNAVFPTADFDNWPLCLRLLPHAMAVAGLVEQFDFSFLEACDVLRRTAVYLRSRARYAEAKALFEQVLSIARRNAQGRDAAVAEGLVNLAVLASEQGDFHDAETLFREALDAFEATLGPDHLEVGKVLHNLAAMCKDQHRYEEAESLSQRALHVWETALGPDHPNVAFTLSNLAGVYQEQGRYADGEALCRRVLSIREQALGADHPQVAMTLNTLALLCNDQGKTQKASEYLERALQIQRQALPADHPQLALSLNNLAELLSKLHQYAQAEPFFAEALSIRRQKLKPNHPHLLRTVESYARCLREAGRDEEAARIERGQ